MLQIIAHGHRDENIVQRGESLYAAADDLYLQYEHRALVHKMQGQTKKFFDSIASLIVKLLRG